MAHINMKPPLSFVPLPWLPSVSVKDIIKHGDLGFGMGSGFRFRLLYNSLSLYTTEEAVHAQKSK